MNIGIITLVGDNYGNKYQNYATEQLVSEYGKTTTFRLAELNRVQRHTKTVLQKIKPVYFRDVLISRIMYRYGMNRLDKGVIYNIAYVIINRKKLMQIKNMRSNRFADFEAKYLHIAKDCLDYNNTTMDWCDQFDYFICGSDQIWNPMYATTSELAFCSFAPEKTVCISPSFGVSKIPEFRQSEYKKLISRIYKLSVRENAGKKIIKDLTGRDAEVFLDPTMLIDIEKWNELCEKPSTMLPERYIVCYFLGRITKEYKRQIESISKERHCPVVMLFDIMTPEFYTLSPQEVLYTIKNADIVLTDSFHGTVFSILFHRNFVVFDRLEGEGGSSMKSRLETLLEAFDLKQNALMGNEISEEKWNSIERVLAREKERIKAYLECFVN